MDRLSNFLKKRNYDYLIILLGIITILSLNTILIRISAIIGIAYYVYAIWLFSFNKVKFDWHLINGSFLRKVCLLAILTPLIFYFLLQDFACLNNIFKIENLLSIPDKDAKYDNLLWTIYFHFIDPGNQYMTLNGNERTWSFIISIFGVVILNGVLISSIIVWVNKRKERWLNGEEPYKSFLQKRKHYVIIGGNDMVSGIVKQIFDKAKKTSEGFPYILIQTSRSVEQFRRELFSNFKSKEQKHIIIVYGNRNIKRDIKHLYLNKAEEVFILGEDSRFDDMESYHDTMNMKCLTLIYENIENVEYFNKLKEDKRLIVRFMFEYQTTFNVFQYSEISEKIKKRINFKPFHYYDMLAQKVLVNKELNPDAPYEFLPLEGINGIKKDDEDYVHLVIVGMTRIGIAFATQAALIAHYPNYVTKKIRTKITFIDENADKEKNFFIDRYDRLFALSNWQYKEMVRGNNGGDELKTIYTYKPVDYDYLGGDFLDIEWEFIKGSVAQLELQKYIEECASKPAKMTIAICKDEPSRCVATALNLDWAIYKTAQQVLVYNRYDDALINKINHEMFGKYFKAFGMAKECFSYDLLKDSEFIAKELQGVYDNLNNETKDKEENPKQENQTIEKENKPSQQKGISEVAEYWSNIYSANTLWTKLRCVDRENNEINIEEKEILAEVEHNRWNIEKLIMSYRHLTKEEQDIASKSLAEKERLKAKMAHLDICSNEKLKEVDKKAIQYDEGIAEELLRMKKELL